MSFKVLKAGLFTTLQDKGRYSYQRFGMSVAGAMDGFALRIANLLVGNDQYEVALESTFLGPTLEFEEHDVISITGADMSPKINGNPIPMWMSIYVKPGDKLSFSGVKSGLRSYIAFSRKLDVPLIMGSRSTFTRGKIGGYEGRKLNDNDKIKFRDKELSLSKGSFIKKDWIPVYKKEETIRVILGPQDEFFMDDSIEVFLNSTYTITNEADRMGYRLDGEKIVHKVGADIISDGIVFGSIQVPGHGMPIIMMADRATTGGYTKIATVITPDLSVLAQMAPGSKINFSQITIQEANNLYRANEAKIKDIQTHITSNSFDITGIRTLNLNIDGIPYRIDVNEIV